MRKDLVLLAGSRGRNAMFFMEVDANALPVRPQGVGADPHAASALPAESKEKADGEPSFLDSDEMTIRIGRAAPLSGKPPFIYPHQLFIVCFRKTNNNKQTNKQTRRSLSRPTPCQVKRDALATTVTL